MPEHMHIVIWIPNESTISNILKSIKSSVSKRALYWVRKNAPDRIGAFKHVLPGGKNELRFWQAGGGYERLLRNAKDVHEKIYYVHANPVRRGLAAEPIEWFWSSYRAYTQGIDEPISLDREHIPSVVNRD